MARIRWNFASRRRWVQPPHVIFIAALAGCMHAFWWRDALLQQRTDMIEQMQIADTATGHRGRQITSPTPAALDHVFDEMRYPWNDILESLQRASKPGVEILHLEPDADNVRRVRIDGIADGVQSIFGLLALLQNDPLWSSVQLVSRAKADDPAMQQGNASGSVPYPPLPVVSSHQYTFTLVAQWKHA
jgi:hypothetical protein